MATPISDSSRGRQGQGQEQGKRQDSGREQPTVVSLDGEKQVAYAEYGCSDGAPVVFLHGTPGSRRLGALFDAAARERDIRVLAPDRPGYGRSTHWSSRSIHDADAVITAVLDDADEEVAGLVAFSGGAPHALATVATQPDRINRVDVVAGATPPGTADSTPAIQRLLGKLATATPTVLRGLLRGQAWLADRLDPSFVVSQYTNGTESIPDDVAAIVKADFVEAISGHGVGAVTDFRDAATAWELPAGTIETDVCFWHGAEDTNVPIDGVRRFKSQFPTARLNVFDDADHLQTLVRSIPAVLDAHDRAD
ncbi:alpha/beta hydrolase [Haloferax mediterranei ATCC 33500]|uniref:Alpha/beta fold family hydrolase n=1 Tax=Haloferax mediterranei (strain ATCC 33500 / DSM 1411 / JCM 8866 / NBRC 14739 / NCIMB 2177 / R-4) TaxID=523841 RepID=I3R7Z8_HALMT|nr:alpha/beta hydrolase [Haloferax mediterranei]AFK20358.1 alpha/beta fold family hydrolase [Haloferax mediterranei ATCC 33500]AHZ23725.1 alpha/beta hydrolase [Haloferax mediterranei ATCC 33500]ELZ99213.1 alpha/beta fold family hydrolase [Haloferax mediterranei ATCC 33500]MDX5986887.1 alpha/beta hydrolase [Haloferax mediterranei ATCC 33500]QCQ76209.1 alpha/beta hydrolase [Haloferax mediterranei ATCC 33500]